MKTEFLKELERQSGANLQSVPISNNTKPAKTILNLSRLQTNVWSNTIMDKPKL